MDRSELLKPFVPRLVVEWLRHAPDEPFRRVDGSLAFVDISGFTSMTERLARKGKVGAEEMNDVLDALFTELLAVAYDDGAGLVKWGGDAVLLLFDGEDHAPRACRAAVNMQATIRRIGKITTSVGHVRLRMSIGIHSGPFDFFLVGDPEIHRELVIVGPSSTETVRMEQIAEAGEVAVSAATASMIDPDSVGKSKEDALLLRFRSQVPFQPARPGPDIRGIELEQLVPVALREYLLTEETQPEHRRITAQLSMADDVETAEVLRSALEASWPGASDRPTPPVGITRPVRFPGAGGAAPGGPARRRRSRPRSAPP